MFESHNEFDSSMSAIGNLGRDHISWIVDGVLPPGDQAFDAGSHAVERHIVLTTMLLWREMSRMISQRGRPLHAGGGHLLPKVVATWNWGKGPINVYSRFQKTRSGIMPIWDRLVPFGCVYS